MRFPCDAQGVIETYERGDGLDANALLTRTIHAASDKAKREYVSTSRGFAGTCACLAKVRLCRDFSAARARICIRE